MHEGWKFTFLVYVVLITYIEVNIGHFACLRFTLKAVQLGTEKTDKINFACLLNFSPGSFSTGSRCAVNRVMFNLLERKRYHTSRGGASAWGVTARIPRFHGIPHFLWVCKRVGCNRQTSRISWNSTLPGGCKRHGGCNRLISRISWNSTLPGGVQSPWAV